MSSFSKEGSLVKDNLELRRLLKLDLLAVDFDIEEALRTSANRESLVFGVSTPTFGAHRTTTELLDSISAEK